MDEVEPFLIDGLPWHLVDVPARQIHTGFDLGVLQQHVKWSFVDQGAMYSLKC